MKCPVNLLLKLPLGRFECPQGMITGADDPVLLGAALVKFIVGSPLRTFPGLHRTARNRKQNTLHEKLLRSATIVEAVSIVRLISLFQHLTRKKICPIWNQYLNTKTIIKSRV
jgi:hypothetical protein